MCGGAQEAASGLVHACLALLCESEGLSSRRGIRSAPQDHVGSYSSNLVSGRRYADYPGGGDVGPNLCGDCNLEEMGAEVSASRDPRAWIGCLPC
jgi:hypothetical protein